MANSIPYLRKTFTKPKFICHDGICDTDLVANTIQWDIAPRCQSLLHPVEKGETAEDSWAAIPKGPPIKLQVIPIAVTPKSSASEPDQVQSLSTVVDLISDVWNGSEPINYVRPSFTSSIPTLSDTLPHKHAQIHLGTPPVPFYVDLDTGSSLLWLQSVLSPKEDPPIPDQSVYHPARSTTSTSLNDRTTVTYADGSNLIASLYSDTVRIGNLTATSQTLGAAATHEIHDTFRNSKSNGIMGLGDFGRKNIVQTLKLQGRIKHASIALVGPRNDPKLADRIDREKILQPRGHLVVGSVDRTFYTGEIAWCSTEFLRNQERWLVKLDEVRINRKTVVRNQLAMIDTGTAYIVVSQPNFATVKAAIPGAEDITEKKDSAMFSFPEAELSSVEFVFGGRSMELRRQDFGLGGIRVGDNRMCSSIVGIPGQKWREVFRGMEQVWIIGGIIGGIFLDNIVTVFDFEKRRIGFATIAADKEVAWI